MNILDSILGDEPITPNNNKKFNEQDEDQLYDDLPTRSEIEEEHGEAESKEQNDGEQPFLNDNVETDETMKKQKTESSDIHNMTHQFDKEENANFSDNDEKSSYRSRSPSESSVSTPSSSTSLSSHSRPESEFTRFDLRNLSYSEYVEQHYNYERSHRWQKHLQMKAVERQQQNELMGVGGGRLGMGFPMGGGMGMGGMGMGGMGMNMGMGGAGMGMPMSGFRPSSAYGPSSVLPPPPVDSIPPPPSGPPAISAPPPPPPSVQPTFPEGATYGGAMMSSPGMGLAMGPGIGMGQNIGMGMSGMPPNNMMMMAGPQTMAGPGFYPMRGTPGMGGGRGRFP